MRLAWEGRLGIGDVAAVAVFAPVAVLLVWLSRDLSFFYDEWGFLLDRSLTLESLLRPWNGHIVLVPALIWRVLIETVGTGSYWPYLFVNWIAHAGVVAMVYVMVRSRASVSFAVGAALVMAVLGAGAENILWAFQVGMIGATALGLCALWIVRRHPAVSAVLLTLACFSHGVGLAFVAGTVVHRFARHRSPELVGLAVSVVAFLALVVLTRGFALPSRYVYVVAPALLTFGAITLSGRRLAPVVFSLVLVANLALMVSGHDLRLKRQRCEDYWIPASQRMLSTELRPYPC